MLTIENRSGRTRRLSVTAYAEWVLGTSRGGERAADRHRARPGDAGTPGAQPVEHRVRRPGRVPRPRRAADGVDRRPDRVPRPQRRPGRPGRPRPRAPAPGRRRRRPGPVRRPADEHRARRRGADPGRGAARRGGRRAAAATDLIRRGRAPTTRPRCAASTSYWDDTQGTIQVRTPDRSMDIMLNRWLIYQTLACRLWARAALLPGRRRVRVPRPAAGRHRPGGRQARARPASTCCGPRPVSSSRETSSTGGTRRPAVACEPASRTIALWLPYAVDRYLAVTGDTAVLDEIVPFLEGPALQPGQDDAYFQPERSARDRARCSSTARAAHRPEPRRSAPTACR